MKSHVVRHSGRVGVGGEILGNEAGRSCTAAYATLSQKDDDVESLEDFKHGSAIMRVTLYVRITLTGPYFL